MPSHERSNETTKKYEQASRRELGACASLVLDPNNRDKLSKYQQHIYYEGNKAFLKIAAAIEVRKDHFPPSMVPSGWRQIKLGHKLLLDKPRYKTANNRHKLKVAKLLEALEKIKPTMPKSHLETPTVVTVTPQFEERIITIIEAIKSKHIDGPDPRKYAFHLLFWLVSNMHISLTSDQWRSASIYVTEDRTTLIFKAGKLVDSIQDCPAKVAVELSSLSKEALLVLKLHVVVLSDFTDQKKFETLKNGCHKLLSEIQKGIGIKKRKERITLRISSHFSANEVIKFLPELDNDIITKHLENVCSSKDAHNDEAIHQADKSLLLSKW